MNLHVNLIEDSEKRSGSSVRVIFVTKAILITLPVLFLLFASLLLFRMHLAKGEINRTRELIAARKDQIALSAEVKKQKAAFTEMRKRLESWNRMRIESHSQLAAIRLCVPLEIQLTSLRLTRTDAVTNNAPVAHYTLQLRGKTGGQTPELHLTRLRAHLLRHADLTNALESVEAPPGSFVEDRSAGANPTDRLFLLDCAYTARRMSP